MNKILTITLLFAFFLLGKSPLFAQWTNDAVTVNVNANMPEITQLQFTESGNLISLDDAAVWSTIGTMQARSNQTDGYIITVNSLNGGVLEGPLGETVTYSLRYGGAEHNLSTPGVTVSTANGRTSFAGVSSEVEVLPVVDLDSNFLYAGTYTDVLTFTISAQ